VTAPPSGSAALFFLFKPTSARPGDLVAVRTGGTPARFGPSQRVRPFQPALRLYLVPNSIAPKIRSRFDVRLHYIGSLVPDKNMHGVLRFSVPVLPSNRYAVAVWCPWCARFSGGRTFHVLHVDRNIAPRYRPQMVLRVEMPAAAATCPATVPAGGAPPGERPNRDFYGNGTLWTALPLGGAIAAVRHPDGTLRYKLMWWAAGLKGRLAIRGERLDARSPPPATQSASAWPPTRFRGSAFWTSIVLFPAEGCWKITGRVRDVSLSFVVRVLERKPRAWPR
jgi:hypothetical protein